MVTNLALAVVWVLLSYCAIELALYWAPLIGRLRSLSFPRKRESRDVMTGSPLTTAGMTTRRQFCIVTACRDGAVCVPGFVRSLQRQTLSSEQYRLYLVADHCSDDSAGVARSLGMEVYERQPPKPSGKGNALRDLLAERLQKETFDVLVVLDIDAEVEPDFLERLQARFDKMPRVVSCATVAKNPDQTWLAQVGTVIQALLRLHQEGRAAWGWNAMLYGSHGYALSRAALDRLDWQMTTGLVAEDMELRLRCTVRNIPLVYAPDLPVSNDVTADVRSVYTQRLRWNATYPPLIGKYLMPLLRQGKFEALFGVLLQPTFANFFLYLSFLVLGLSVAAVWLPAFRPAAVAVVVLWAADVAYFLTAFKVQKIPLGWRHWSGFAGHLAIRTGALIEGLFWTSVKDWAPAPHPPKREK